MLRIWPVSVALFSHFLRHPSQALFLLLGLSAGVAMYLTTLMLSAAAEQTFLAANQAIGGEIVAEVRPANGANYIPESLYRLLKQKGIEGIPVLEGHLKTNLGILPIQGFDAFPMLNQTGKSSQRVEAEPVTREFENALEAIAEEQGNAFFQFMFPPYSLLMSRGLSESVGYQGELSLVSGAPLPKVSLLADEVALGRALLCDLRCSQLLLDKPERVTSIRLFQLTHPEQLEALLGDTAQLVQLDKQISNPAFSKAFFLNLQGIGLLALVVGIFMAFNAARFSVHQRAETVETCRLCGASALEIHSAFAIEMLGWAIVASLCGLFMALLFSALLLPGLGLTLLQLFGADNVVTLHIGVETWLIALAIALLASVIALWQPFRETLRQRPKETISRRNNTGYLRLSLILGAVTLLMNGIVQNQLTGLLSAAALLFATVLLIPWLLTTLFRRLERRDWLQRWPLIHWCWSEDAVQQRHQSLALMAYAISLAASIGIITMVISFEKTFNSYLDTLLAESIYLRLNQSQVEEVSRALNNHPAVAHQYRFYRPPAILDNRRGYVRAMDVNPLRQQSVSLEQDSSELWEELSQREGVLINQALALQAERQTGQTISLEINGMEITTKVLGVFHSYGNLTPEAIIDEAWLKQIWPELVTDRIGVYLHESHDSEAVQSVLSQQYNVTPGQMLLPETLKTIARNTFHQTFAATRILSFSILVIACIGIFSAAYTDLNAQRQQAQIIQWLGVSRLSVATGLWSRQGLTLCFASLLSIPIGLMVAWISIFLILKPAFGWYFPVMIAASDISGTTGLAIVIALLGSALGSLFVWRKSA